MQENKDTQVEISIGTVYDMNKKIMEQVGKQLSIFALNEKIKNLVTPFFLKTKKELQPKYFMLLCHERRDYTLFRLDWFSNDCANNAAIELKQCLINRGLIYGIDNTQDGVALQIWIKDEKEFYCYYLFPYDEGVIEV